MNDITSKDINELMSIKRLKQRMSEVNNKLFVNESEASKIRDSIKSLNERLEEIVNDSHALDDEMNTIDEEMMDLFLDSFWS